MAARTDARGSTGGQVGDHMKVVAIGSPKGGVGKTTTAVTVAVILAKLGLRGLLVDCDGNGWALEWCADAGETIPLDVSDGRDLAVLRRLRQSRGYDLAVVDLPGARAGAFQAVLTGTTRERQERPPHLVVLTRVDPVAMNRARDRRTELRDGYRLAVAETVIRDYVAYREALERSRTVLDVGGPLGYARRAERDYRALTAEVVALL